MQSSTLDLAVTTELQEPRRLDAIVGSLMRLVSLAGNYPWAELLVSIATLALLLWRDWRKSLLVLAMLTADLMVLLAP